MIPLPIPTFDNTAITWDTVNFTFDGACIVNGGAVCLCSCSFVRYFWNGKYPYLPGN